MVYIAILLSDRVLRTSLRLATPCQYELFSPASTAASPQELPWLRTAPNSVPVMIHDYATTLFGTAQRLDSVLEDYFSRIHPWLPFLSHQQFHERVSRLSSTSDHNFVLMTCVLHLVLSVPPQAEVGPSRSAQYLDIKRLLALAESQELPTIDLVHSRVLLALYEINHGATDDAYLTLGMCARAGVVLGLDRVHQQRDDIQHRSWIQAEEQRRTWWAITILDR